MADKLGQYRWIYHSRCGVKVASTAREQHLQLMRRYGLPSSGRGYDRVVRGFASFMPGVIKVWEENSKPGEFIPEDVFRYFRREYPGAQLTEEY